VNAPLKDIADELRDRARQGDPQAACRLAFEMDRCARLPERRRFAAEIRQHSTDASKDDDMRRRMDTSADFFEGFVRRDEPVCSGVETGALRGGWRYLLQAAQAGHVPSMVRFAGGWTLTVGGGSPGENLDGWNALRDLGPSFLQAGIDGGFAEAFEQARFAHMRGDLFGIPFPKDPRLSVAYSLALARAGTPGERERSEPSARHVAREAGLSDEDYARADVLAATLAQKIIARSGAGTVDFTRGTYAKDDGSHCEAPPGRG